MLVEIDTNSNFDNKELPDGKQTFKILEARQKGLIFVFRLGYGNGQEGEIIMFANRMGDFLKCLECKESEKGKYIVDLDLLVGKSFEAEVYQEADKKTGKMYKRMRNYAEDKDAIPF